MAQIAAWVATHAPRLMVVDVSVEVTVLVRSMGVPTVVMGMPGVRDDAAHQLAYRLADAIIAPWPAWADVLVGGAAWQDEDPRGRCDLALRGRAPADRPAARRSPRVLVSRAGAARS